MKQCSFLLGVAFMILDTLFASVAFATPDNAKIPMAIQLKMNGHVLTATLNHSQAAHDLCTQLPLTLTLEDYANAEKISILPHKLRTTGSPVGSSAKAGDIAYYAPWGNLVFFYQDVRYANGLVILGHINGDSSSALNGKDNLRVTIEATP